MRYFAALFALCTLAAANVASACNFDEAKQDAVKILGPVVVRGNGQATYRQTLKFPDGTREPLNAHADYAYRETAFAVLDTETCKVEVFRQVREVVGGALTPPTGGPVRLADRAFGPIWNDFNTQTTTGNSKRVVVGIKWLFFSLKGTVFYVPYSRDFASTFPELGEIGRIHFTADMDESLALLLKGGLIDSELERELHAILPMIFAAESIDPFEFKAADEATRARLMNQPFVTLGANGPIAYTLKVSSAGAKGPMQVWGPSCHDVRHYFTSVKLAEDCNSAAWGTHEHIANIVAAALEYKLHRATLVRLLGKKVLRRADFPRMMMASYNGGPGHVVKAFRQYGEKWDRAHFVKPKKRKQKVLSKNSLRAETVDYLLKYDELTRATRAAQNNIVVAGSR